jgi:hypothetical protein
MASIGCCVPGDSELIGGLSPASKNRHSSYIRASESEVASGYLANEQMDLKFEAMIVKEAAPGIPLMSVGFRAPK